MLPKESSFCLTKWYKINLESMLNEYLSVKLSQCWKLKKGPVIKGFTQASTQVVKAEVWLQYSYTFTFQIHPLFDFSTAVVFAR